MISKEKIERILARIRKNRKQWKLSPRRKNLLTLTSLGLDEQAVFDFIDKALSWKDYVSGPDRDNHEPPIPGEIWIFGLTIEKQLCYLKFQDRPNGLVIWISIHKAEYPIYFLYKKG